jgi:glycosyltransferase involved in cell wall biosynthesis/CDP-glycerol glycerophosphotransferase (TagB/SpsB family)
MAKIKKKWRKLRRDPVAFVRDFLANRARQLRQHRQRLAQPPEPQLRPGTVRAARRYSVVSAVYNVAPYLDAFFESLTRQTLDFATGIELIVVDDGSTDRSPEIIAKWRRRYPENIVQLRKENGGQASARNLGLRYATGRWVTFLDPDDFIAPDYFAEVERVLAAASAPPSFVSCNFVFYDESTKAPSDTHPLRYRFARGEQCVDFAKPTRHIQLSAPTAFFDAQVIARHSLTFGETIRPSFEDAHFVNTYLLHVPERAAVFVPSARYFYRKRRNGTSTLDTAWTHPGLFGVVLEDGVLALMHSWRAQTGSVPAFVQRTVLYHLLWYFKRLINAEHRIAFLDNAQKARFLALLRECFAQIDAATINDFELAGIWFFHRVGLLATFKAAEPPHQIVYVDTVDFTRRLLKLRYFCGAPGHESFSLDEERVGPLFETVRTHTFVGETFVRERIVWLPLRPHGQLAVMLGGKRARLSLNGKQHPALAMADILDHFAAVRRTPKAAPKNASERVARALAWLAARPVVQRRYGDAWVLMDRDVQADDNAEHLYRHLRTAHPEVNARFLLARRSHDWKRLKREDFRLVPFGSLRHTLLMLNASHLIASHIDRYVLDAVPASRFPGRLRYRLTFLQHGVTKDDLSDWFNTKDIDCLVTASPQEYASIAGSGTRYKFSARETALTGFPRHDALAAHAGESAERVILIMPTWRAGLAGSTRRGTFRRRLNASFTESEYFRQWNALLASPALAAMAAQFGYRVQFYPHANVALYASCFDLPPHCELVTHPAGSIQDVFRRAAVMVTDYSSVAFEFALLRRPVVYFQFDREAVFNGAHIYRQGYFDYERDGFGPVCLTHDETLGALQGLLARGAKPEQVYAARAASFLPLRDGGCCERTYRAIAALDKPASAPAPTVEAVFAADSDRETQTAAEAILVAAAGPSSDVPGNGGRRRATGRKKRRLAAAGRANGLPGPA